jgi:hypothetical protein
MARDLVQPHLRNDRRAQGRPLASPRRLPAGAGQRADHLDGETRGLSVTLPMFHGNGWCLPCIVDEQLWDAVQARLAAVAREICRQVHTTTRPPLFRSAQMRFLWWRNGDPRSQGLRNPHMLFDFPESGSCTNSSKFRLDAIEGEVFSTLYHHSCTQAISRHISKHSKRSSVR